MPKRWNARFKRCFAERSRHSQKGARVTEAPFLVADGVAFLGSLRRSHLLYKESSKVLPVSPVEGNLCRIGGMTTLAPSAQRMHARLSAFTPDSAHARPTQRTHARLSACTPGSAHSRLAQRIRAWWRKLLSWLPT